jgi:hypothetical protein
MPDDTAPRYQRERLTFWVAFFVGLGLLYWSSVADLPKFWDKLTESVGQALILACVIDFFFKGVVAQARLRDHKTQDDLRQVLGGWKKWMADRELQEPWERTQRALAAIEEKLERLDRSNQQARST